MPPDAIAVAPTPSTPAAATQGTPAQATPAGQTPTSTAKPDKAADKAAQRERMREVSRSVLGKAAPATSSTPAAAAPAAESAARIEQAGGAVPEQRANESDKNYEVRLSKALSDLQRAQNEAVTHRTRGDKAEKRVQELELSQKDLDALIARVKSDPEYALELAGHTPDSIAQMMIEGKVKRGRYAHLSPEDRKRMETLERKDAEREAEAKRKTDAEAAEAEHASKRAADLGFVAEKMGELGSKFSLISRMPNANERVLSALYQHLEETGKQPDLEERLAHHESALEADWSALLTNEASATRLCNLPGVRDTLLKVLGLPAREQSSQATPASDDRGKQTNEDGPRSLSQHIASEVPGRVAAPADERERRLRIREAGRQVLKSAAGH